jgi:hypothetical protein
MAREKQPTITIDDLHPPQDNFVHSYTGTWQEAGVIATWELDVVDRDHWQPGHYRSHAYELLGSMRTVSGRPLGPLQEETGRLLLQALKEQMLAAMGDAGWQQIDTTKDERPIYLYRPAPILPIREALAGEEPEAIAPDPQEPRRTRIYEVYGNDEARQSGSPPAYSRKVPLKPMTFQCAICGQTVTEEHLPGQKPRYCQKKACQREAVRLRVAKSREEQKKKQRPSL